MHISAWLRSSKTLVYLIEKSGSFSANVPKYDCDSSPSLTGSRNQVLGLKTYRLVGLVLTR